MIFKENGNKDYLLTYSYSEEKKVYKKEGK